MERLTESNGSTYMAKDVLDYATPEILDRLGRYEDLGCTPEQLKLIDKWYGEMCRELGEYKRLEEQGSLLRLPCKVGDTVYVIAPNYNKCENHYECDEYDSKIYLITWCQDNCPKGFSGIGIVETEVTKIEIRHGDIYTQTDKCGMRNTKNVFLTKEEAEQALADRKGV